MSTEKPIKLAAKLPKGNANGLDAIHEQVKKHGSAYVVMLVSAPEVLVRIGGTREPKLTIDHIEGLPAGPLADQGERLLLEARKARTGDDAPGLFDLHEPDTKED